MLMQSSIQISKKIMKRVYLAYVASILSSPLTLYFSIFFVSLTVFTNMVFVARVIENILAVSVKDAPTYIWQTLVNGEAVTLLALGAMVFTALSIQWRIRGLFTRGIHSQTQTI